jgi:hypothetical protein
VANGEGFPTRFAPYGDNGVEAASYAADLYADLARTSETPESADDLGLEELSELELLRTRLRPEHFAAIGEPQDQLDDIWTVFHTALPFSEGERVWVVEKVRGVDRVDETLDYVVVQEGEIVASGLRTRVSGRELMRRWIAWRHETDEYAGQGTLDVAREALAGLVVHLNPWGGPEQLPQ